MEAEKIKQIVKEFISSEEDGFVRNEHGVIWFESENGQQGINLEVYFEDIVEFALEKASQFKQPPVSVMPSYGEILEKFLSEMRDCPFHIKHNEQVYELGDIVKTLKKCLSLSKEAPNERIPDVGETIKETAIEKVQVKNIAEFVMSCGGEPRHETMDWLHKHFIVLRRSELFDLFKQRK